MGNIGSLLRFLPELTWWTSTSGAGTLNDDIDKAQQLVDKTHPDHTDLARRLDELSGKVIDRYSQTGDIQDLDRAIDNAQRAVDITPPNHPHRATWLNNLAAVLSDRYNQTGNTEDLADSIQNAQLALDITPPDHADLAMRIGNLATQLSARYKHTSSMGDLEAAVQNARQAVIVTPPGHIDLAVWFNNLANILADKYSQSGDHGDLEEAIDNAQKAVEISKPGNPYMATYLNNLANHIAERHSLTGCRKDLENATITVQRAIDITLPGSPDLPQWLSNLSAILQDRYHKTGNIEDLETAIGKLRQAVNITPPGSLQLAIRLHNLAGVLSDRYSRLGNTKDLEDAIDIARRVVDMTPPDHTARARRLNSLGANLSYRYDRSGNTADLEYAIINIQQAVELGGDPLSAMHLSNLANLLFDRYERSNNDTDLVHAIAHAQEATKVTPPDHPEQATWLVNLAVKLLAQYKRTGNAEALDNAIINTRKAIAVTQPGHPDLAMQLGNLADMLANRSSQRGGEGDLREAIQKAQQAVDLTPPEHPDAARWMTQLANFLSRTGDSRDREAAHGHYDRACDTRSTLPLHRIQAARQQIQLLVEQRSLSEASRVASKTIPLLPLVCGRYLSRKDQQHGASQISGLAADACSLALCLNPPDARAALEHIEYGRGLILSHLIDNRDDLSDVEERSRDLAAECRSLRVKVERLSRNRPTIDGTSRTSTREKIWREREQTVKELEGCQERIRDVLNYPQFPPRLGIHDFEEAAKEGPVVIVNATDISCDAIIMQPGGSITHVKLADMQLKAPPQFQEKLANHRAVDEYFLRHARELDKNDDLETEHQAAEDYLSWLWSHCVQKVLATSETLAAIPHSPDEDIPPSKLPRIWWIGTGAASSLPFHAATRFSGAARCAESTMSRAVSSYATTLKTLIYSRNRATHRRAALEDLSVLLVAMPSSPGSHALPAVEAERVAIEGALRDQTCDVLVHPAAEEVLGRLKGHAVVHFACHGKADHTDPSNTYLLLQAQDKTGRDIAPSHLTASMISDELSLEQRGAWIAYLSACSTAEVRASQLADEGLHLASAFQVAGFTHVIGTLQPVNDNACAAIAGFFYCHLVANYGANNANRLVADALHSALNKALKRKEIKLVDVALYIHFGA